MSKLKIGIMPRDEFQRRILDIAAGKITPKREDPKIWFSSMKSLGEVLSDNNIRLLKLINEHHPETLGELARLSGRHTSNLSRTLKTMEKYGIVELKKHAQKVQVITKATEFDIQYAIG
ncbi:MarR family transcriptional regulator [Colwellia sp. MSW7]|jgi:predicted transcriptional regulator|uniref:MarR family transcriptional regulator n=1 Tax=Colwellia maritima TaxID=2912588 RepID=A0ABS9X6L1_9GAMM|nr:MULTISPECIES: MarR family transcriptional regulator [Colwellia]MBA6414561.1 MarR family transcriptional regulator [Colwellia sp. 6M3]MCI2282088.1 MarR family transcriptional regulator [Colwellia maritima]MCI2285862.1 MarR family transcriptional regulator [Colwellia maritima]MCI2286030.1 MarR family transcriptional regulator [Colwellia maritima]|tara:strand:- start:3866 stop:4222 length:357 start_codon:yes stop_codon:yes gene_type:complete